MMDTPRPRVGVVALHYHAPYAARTLDVLNRSATRFRPVEVVLVANTPQVHASLRQLCGDKTLLLHDNVGMEFGGYQAGIDHLMTRHDLDWIFFVNDTVGNTDNYPPPYHAHFAAALAGRIDIPTIVGRVNSLSRSFRIGGCRTHRWIRSNVFALNRSALDLLGARLYETAIERLVHESADLGRFFDAAMDPVLKEHMGRFMFDRSAEWHWHGARPLAADNAAAMARKARSILQEKFLSARLDQASAAFRNIMDLGLKDRLRLRISDFRFQRRRPSR